MSIMSIALLLIIAWIAYKVTAMHVLPKLG